VRVGPPWFGAWCARRETAARQPPDLALLAVAIYYKRPATAARWLADVFGFDSPNPLPGDDDAYAWIEFRVGNCSLMVFKLEGELPGRVPTTHMPWVYVHDLETHFATAKGKGATVVQGIHQHGYRAYVAEDLEGHQWTFAQARPTMR
jgi:uncharacterized glyoxalase superfamily protein PhnB